jgi:hypothetical protein
VFARITVKVQDHYWTIYGIQEPIREWTREMPRISIVQPQWDSLFLVTDPAEMILLASPSVSAPVADAQWSGGEDPPTGGGSSFTTAFRLKIDEQWIEAALDGIETLLKLFVVGIEKVEWVTVPNGGEIQDLPGAYDLRFFPDWTPDDMLLPESNRPNRQRVAIKATLKKAVPNIPVSFKVVDIDDPSAAAAPIDANDEDKDGQGNMIDDDGDGYNVDGYDNRGPHTWSNDPSGRIGTNYHIDPATGDACIETDVNGVCSVVVEVSLQPGDNYLAVASLSSSRNFYPGSAPGLPPTVYYWYRDERRLFPDWPDRYSWATDKWLTVWRKLWYEFGSMGVTPQWDNHHLIFGPETGSSTDLYPQMLYDFSKDWLSEDGIPAFDNEDKIYPSTALRPTVFCWVVDNGEDWIYVLNPWLLDFATVGDPYKVMTLDHDCGDIPQPGADLLVDAFKPAFVVPLALPGNLAHPQCNSIPWKNYVGSVVNYTENYSNKHANNHVRFWQVFAFGAYEYAAANDGDRSPSGAEETVYFGATDKGWWSPKGSAVFKEVNVQEFDADVQNFRWSQTTLHELGHQMRLVHDDDTVNKNATGVMYESPETLDPSTLQAKHFSWVSVSKIRSLNKPE